MWIMQGFIILSPPFAAFFDAAEALKYHIVESGFYSVLVNTSHYPFHSTVVLLLFLCRHQSEACDLSDV